MKSSLTAGLTATRRVVVDSSRVIGFMGDAGRVYGTPALLMDLETTCHDLLLEHLDEGEESVGTRVEMDHLAATPLGMTVEITVTVASVEKRAIVLDIAAKDDLDEICRGRHRRFVVDIARTLERIAAKSKAAGGS